jgi:hypothetical protein
VPKTAIGIVHTALEQRGHNPRLLTGQDLDKCKAASVETYAIWYTDTGPLITLFLLGDGSLAIQRFPGLKPIESFGSIKSLEFYLDQDNGKA